MAQATGFTCDNPACATFEVGVHDGSSIGLPEGWVTLTPTVKSMTSAPNKKVSIEVCSDRCAAEVSIMRWEAKNPGKRFVRSAASRALSSAPEGDDDE